MTGSKAYKTLETNCRPALRLGHCGFFGHWIRGPCPFPAAVGDPGR